MAGAAGEPSERRLAFAAAREICRRHARGFYFASSFLPRAKRDAAYAVYAFCRMIEAAIDVPDPASSGACTPNELESRLAMLSDRLNDVYEGRMDLPNAEFRNPEQNVLYALSLAVRRYEIPREYFLDLAEGCRMDLTISRYATWNALESYCYRVAGVLGLIMSCVFGLTHSHAGKQAVLLGNAMQLTNILRDIREDFSCGRIYLPLEDMARFKYTQQDLAAGVVNDHFRELMRFEIDRARKMFRDGAQGICWLAGDGSRLTASTMAVVYSGILNAIERQNYDVFSRRVRLDLPQKLRRLPAAWRLAWRGSDDPMPRVF